MTFARTLLERLESPEAGSDRTIGRDLEQAKASIQVHLQRLLNSRRGHAPSSPEFGTNDFAQCFEGASAIHTFEREIRESIEQYEPRLTGVGVRFVPTDDDQFRLYFEIEARLVDDEGELPVWFRTVLEDGQVKVYR